MNPNMQYDTYPTVDTKKLRKQRIRDAKTGLILDAALHVLAQKGYHNTRLEDIAEEAGFSKSALYRYYKDKDEIFLTIAVRERKKIFDRLVSHPEYTLLDNDHICTNLRRILSASLSVFGENISFILSLNTMEFFKLINMLHTQDTLMSVEEEFLCCETKMDKLLTTIFDRAKEKGEINSSLSTDTLLDFFDGILLMRVKKWHLQKKMDDLQETIDEILEFIMHGMGITPPA